MFSPSFDSPTASYTFFYDESNNHRKFYINENTDNYNVDKDPSRKQKAEGRRQKAEGRRQKAEGRRQKAEGSNEFYARRSRI